MFVFFCVVVVGGDFVVLFCVFLTMMTSQLGSGVQIRPHAQGPDSVDVSHLLLLLLLLSVSKVSHRYLRGSATKQNH